MKKIYILSKLMLVIIALLVGFSANSQESLTITMDNFELDPNQDTLLTAEYRDTSGVLIMEANIKWNTEPGYLGKVNKDGVLTGGQSGEGLLIAKYKELRDTIALTVTGTPKERDDDEVDYPKVKVVPGSIKVMLGDSVELYAFYIDTADVKIDTTFSWSVVPSELGEFPDTTESMFHSAELGEGIIIATLGDLADTIKVRVIENKHKPNNGKDDNNNGKQLTILPNDTVVYVGADPIQYSATYKTNGNKHQNAEYSWSVSDTSIAKIGSDGLVTLSGGTGMAIVSATYSNFKASTELLVIDSMVDLDVNTISIHRVLADSTELKAKTFKEGESYKIGGLPYPLNILNGGKLHFPFGCISEDITIYMYIPEEYAEMDDDGVEVAFDGIITGVKFSVIPASSDTIVEPFNFNIPVELMMVFKHELLDSLGVSPENLDVFFAENTGFVTDGVDGPVVVDTVRNKIYASIEHFSTIVVRQKSAVTIVSELIDDSEKTMEVFPNPFNTSTNILYKLSDESEVNISIYNLFGQQVKLLVNEKRQEGSHNVSWDGTNATGGLATSGIYLCRMVKDGKVANVKRIVLNR